MAAIREFTAGAAKEGLGPLYRPSDAGAAALAQEARRTGSLYREAGAMQREAGRDLGSTFGGLGKQIADEAGKFITQKEEMKFTASEPDFLSSGILGWRDFASSNDITNPAKVQEFNDSLRDQEQEYVNSFGTERGRQLAADAVARRRTHLFQVQTADSAARLGDMGVQAITDTANKGSALVQTDPTALPLVMDSIDQLRDRLKGQAVTEAERSKYDALTDTMKRQAAHSAFLTMAEKDPAGAKALLQNGWQDKVLDGSDRVTLARMADTFQEVQDRRSKELITQHKQEETEAVNTSFNELFSKAFDPQTMKWNLPALSQGALDIAKQHPGESTGLARSILDYTARIADEQQGRSELGTNDPATFQNFRDRMDLEDTNPNALTRADIYRAAADGKLSTKGLVFFENAIKVDPAEKAARSEYNKYASSLRRLVDPSAAMGGISTPQAYANWGVAQVTAGDMFKQAWQTGGAAGVRDLMDPNNPKGLAHALEQAGLYYNSKAAMKSFQDNITSGSMSPFRAGANKLVMGEHAASTGEGETPNTKPAPTLPSNINPALTPFFAAEHGIIGPPPAKPNEDPDAYFKRTQGK